jgi:hypothetical protein
MEILILIFFTFIASIVGTTTSFGTATFMVPVLGFFYPLSITLLFTGIIHWFGNIWKMLFFKSGKRWNLVFLFGIPGIIASYFGAKLIPDISEILLSRLLGIFFILYVIFLLKNKDWKIPTSKSSAILGGVLSGFSSGIFGVGGAVRAAFLSAYNLKKEVFIFTAGAIGLFIDSGRIAKYVLDGVRLENDLLLALTLAIPTSFFGAYVGKRISGKIPQSAFRNVIALALLLMGLKYLLFPV